jgi:transcriptional regulator with XRE-family HTH domain
MTPQELKEWRLSEGRTQEELAEFCGRNALTVHRWETGQTRIPKYLSDFVQRQIELKAIAKSLNRLASLNSNSDIA